MKKVLFLFLWLAVTLGYGQSTDAALTTQSNVIKNETSAGANTKTRIAAMFQSLIDSKVSILAPRLTTTSTNGYVWTAVGTTGLGSWQTLPPGGVWGQITGTLSAQTDLQSALDAKQDSLVSGTTIKTINGTSLLGVGDITVSTAAGGSNTQIQYNSSGSLAGSSLFTVDVTNKLLSINSLRIGDIMPSSASQAEVSTVIGNGAGTTTSTTASRRGNVVMGYQAMASLTNGTNFYDGAYSVAVGYKALTAMTTGGYNVAVGYKTMTSNLTGIQSTAVGYGAMQYQTGGSNTAFGYQALGGASGQSTATDNTAIGRTCLSVLTTGTRNVGVGPNLQGVTTGNYNVGVGSECFERVSTQSQNIGIGIYAGVYNRGSANVVVGSYSLGQTTLDDNGNTASFNTFVGSSSGSYHAIGDYNTWIGYLAGTQSQITIAKSISIGYGANVTQDNSCVIGGVADANRVNYGFGGESYASGSGVAFFKNAVTNPSGNPTNGFVLYSDGGLAKVLNASGSAITVMGNPMTTEGDLILGGASGAASRLAIGSNAYVLTSNGTTASWQASASGFSDPMTTRGDIIIRNASNATARLGIGTSGYVLTSDGTDISWVAAASGGWAVTGPTTLTGAATIVATGSNTVKFQANSLGTTATDVFFFDTDTDAAAGVQQYSPFTRWRGRGWKTNATAASQTVDFDAGVKTVQAAAAPTGNWVLRTSVNGSAYTNAIDVSSDLNNVGITFLGSSTTLSGTTNGIFTLSGAGILKVVSTLSLKYNITSALTGSYGLAVKNLNPALNYTSSTYSEIGIGTGFAPTSGTGIYSTITVDPTVNQTGGANGAVAIFKIIPTYTAAGAAVTGLDYNPTVTSIAGTHLAFRATSGSVLVGGTTLTTSAILDLQSTTSALILPRMTTTQRDAIASPSAGMIIYNTTTNKLNVYTTTWEAVTSI